MMDRSAKPNKDSGEGSSEGEEEDFESADEGEGKGKSVSTRTQEKNVNSKLQGKSKETKDSERKPEKCVNIHSQDSLSKNDDASSVTSDKSESKENTFSSVSLDENLDGNPVQADQKDKRQENSDERGFQDSTSNIVTHEDVDVKTTLPEPGESEENITEEVHGASGGWSWGGWGDVFNQATASVTSGLSHMIEKVETTLGIPEPGELADVITKDEKEVIITEPKSNEMDRGEDETHKEDDNDPAADKKADSETFLSSWGLSSLSTVVTVKGLELVSEGIGALEMIGKKTMNVISEGDPGLRAKRNAFQKPTLSQVLREAKEKSSKEAAERKNQEVLEKVNFHDEFDRCQGLAHLEALEILSRESEAKVESMLIDMFEDDLEQVKMELRDIEIVFANVNQSDDDDEGREDGEFAEEIGKCAMALRLGFVPDKLNQTEETVSKWLEECIKDQENVPSSRTSEDIYSHVITSLASITAKSIEVFRKVAEMILLIEVGEETVTAKDRAVYLGEMMKVVTNRISSLSTSYAGCLNTAVDDSEDNDNITPVITEVYLECSNSSSHVQDALKLLLPILQFSALNDFKKE